MSGYFIFAQCMVGFIYPVVSETENVVWGGVQPKTVEERRSGCQSKHSPNVMQGGRGEACMGYEGPR